MNVKNLNYLKAQGLHDALLNDIKISFEDKLIIFSFSTSVENIELRLKKIKLLEIDKNNDLKNDEIVLDFNLIDSNEIKLFTTSNTNYRICFEESIVLTDAE